jgi:hypothetical protein
MTAVRAARARFGYPAGRHEGEEPGMRRIAILASVVLLACFALAASASAQTWRPAHIVIVVLENKSFDQLIGDRDMPYLNALARSSALMTQAYFGQTPYGIVPKGYTAPLPARPSQPNYLFLFSGHHQGVLPNWFQDPGSPYTGKAINDRNGNLLPVPIDKTAVGIGNKLIPASLRPFLTPNLGAALIAAGLTFASFSESLPHPRYDEEGDPNPLADMYRRKHNPAINWIDLTGRPVPADKRRFVLPIETNLGFMNTREPRAGKRYRGFAVDETGAPLGYERLPTVSIVVPNEQNDLHSADNAAGDAWLAANIRPYAEWAREHDSLLIVTFDEDGTTDDSRGDPYRTGMHPIVTLFHGPPGKVSPGRYDERIDHLNVLATVLERYGLLESFKRDFVSAHSGPEAANEAANLRPIRDVFGEGERVAPLPSAGR